MRRGDLVIVAAPGDYGKPRPAVMIQTDMLNHSHASTLVCLLSSDLQDAPSFGLMWTPVMQPGLLFPPRSWQTKS